MLILVLIELREVRKMRKAFEYMFGLFWKALDELKEIIGEVNHGIREE